MYQSKATRRIVCSYNHDYTKEFKDVEAGVIPKHRLLLLAEHFDAEQTVYYISANWTIGTIGRWKLVQAILITMYQSRFDEVFCTTESSSWFILLFRAVGLLRLPVIVVNVALLRPGYRSPFVRYVLRLLLKSASAVISYASFQLPLVVALFGVPLSRQRFVKFQVDREFLLNRKSDQAGDFILSVGTNEGRDFATLMRAIEPTMSLIVCTDLRNKEIILRSDNYNPQKHVVLTDVPYLKLLELYSQCNVFVSCLHDVDFSSGQTVIQEAIVLCRNVVVSNVKSVQDYVEPNDHMFLVQPTLSIEFQEILKRIS